MYWWQYLSDKYNVNFEFETSPADGFQEKLNLKLSSKPFPDILYGAMLTSDREMQYGSQGTLTPLNKLIENYEFDGGDFDPRKYGRDITPDHSVQHGLNLGYRFGFTSGGEHEGVGTTGVFARELTRDAIFDALYHRQVYGTTSIHLFATFFADESFMGSEIGTPPAFVTLHGVIRGTDDISAVIAVSNLGEIDLTPHYNPETGKYSTELSTANMEWVYLRVKQADGNMAWMSPIFFGEEKQK